MARRTRAGELFVALRTDETGLADDVEKTLNGLRAKVGALGDGLGKSFGGKFGDSLGGLTSKLGPLGGSIDDLAAGFTAAGGPADVLAGGVAAIGAGAAAAISSVADLAGKVDRLSLSTGSSAEQASKLIAISDDLGISAEDTSRAFANLTKNADAKVFAQFGVEIAKAKDGTTDLVATTANLNERLAGISDPIQRANLLQAAFGKSSQEVLRLTELTRSELEAAAEAAAKSGQVLSPEDLQNARDYKAALDDVRDAVGRIKLTAGKTLIPIAADQLGDLADLTNKVIDLGTALDDLPGGSILTDSIGKAFKTLTNPIGAAKDAIGDFRSQLSGADKGTTELSKAMDVLAGASRDTTVAQSNLANPVDAATEAIKKQEAAIKGLTAQQALADAQAKVNALSGAGIDGQIAAAKATIERAQADRDAKDAAQTIADARRRQADVEVDSARRIAAANGDVLTARKAADQVAIDGAQLVADARKRLEEIEARAPRLAQDVADALKDQARAAGDLKDAQADLVRATEDYDRTIGTLPAKIDDVVAAQHRLYTAQSRIAELSENLADVEQQLVDAQIARADLQANGAEDGARQVAALRLRAQSAAQGEVDARERLAKAAANADGKTTQADIDRLQNSLAQAQLASVEAQRELDRKTVDLLDPSEDIAEADRKVARLLRQRDKLKAIEIPDAAKAQTDAAGKLTADGSTLKGAAVGSDAEVAAAQKVAKATDDVTAAQDRAAGSARNLKTAQDAQVQQAKDVATARKGIGDAALAAAAKEADAARNVLTALANQKTAIADVVRARADAAKATAQVIFDEQLRQKELTVKVLETQKTIQQLPAQTKAALVALGQNIGTVITTGGNADVALQTLRLRVQALNDPKTRKELESLIGLLDEIRTKTAAQATTAGQPKDAGRASNPPTAPGAGAAAKTVTNNITVNNPVAQAAQKDVVKALQMAGADGVLPAAPTTKR